MKGYGRSWGVRAGYFVCLWEEFVDFWGFGRRLADYTELLKIFTYSLTFNKLSKLMAKMM